MHIELEPLKEGHELFCEIHKTKPLHNLFFIPLDITVVIPRPQCNMGRLGVSAAGWFLGGGMGMGQLGLDVSVDLVPDGIDRFTFFRHPGHLGNLVYEHLLHDSESGGAERT